MTALQNAVKITQGLKPIKAEARDLFRRPLMPQELRDYDCVVFDPPRQGAQAQSLQLAASKIALGGRGVVQSGDVRPRRAHPYRWWIQDRKRHAGGSVPPHTACGTGGAVQALMVKAKHLTPPSLLPDLFADQARYTRLTRRSRNDPMFRHPAATSITSLVRIASLNFSLFLIGTTNDPAPPITQSS